MSLTGGPWRPAVHWCPTACLGGNSHISPRHRATTHIRARGSAPRLSSGQALGDPVGPSFDRRLQKRQLKSLGQKQVLVVTVALGGSECPGNRCSDTGHLLASVPVTLSPSKAATALSHLGLPKNRVTSTVGVDISRNTVSQTPQVTQHDGCAGPPTCRSSRGPR